MKQLTIMGMGLMGGSLALAARRRGIADRVAGYARREVTRRQAMDLGMLDAVFDDPAEAVRGADVVVLCVPILVMSELLAGCREALPPGCVVTDVGSTKQQVAIDLDALLAGRDAYFVGSHPIAGSERTGLEAARENLYEDAVTVVTPSDGTPLEATERVAALWRAAGSRVVRMPASRHDRLLARTSHLPHLIAALLVETVSRDGMEAVRDLCGSGFRDTTRIAAGSDTIWHDIVKTNSSFVLSELQAYRERLDRIVEAIAAGDFDRLREWLSEHAAMRDRLGGAPE